MQRTEGCLQDPVQKRQLPPPLDVSFIQTLHRSVSNERNPVEVGFTVYSVTNIDPVSQTFACDLKVFLRWHDSFFANDPDMVSMAASSCMANGDGAVFERVDGIFTKNIVKEIDPVHAAELQPRISFANAASVEEVTQDLVVYLSPNDPLGWRRNRRPRAPRPSPAPSGRAGTIPWASAPGHQKWAARRYQVAVGPADQTAGEPRTRRERLRGPGCREAGASHGSGGPGPRTVAVGRGLAR